MIGSLYHKTMFMACIYVYALCGAWLVIIELFYLINLVFFAGPFMNHDFCQVRSEQCSMPCRVGVVILVCPLSLFTFTIPRSPHARAGFAYVGLLLVF